MLSEQEHRFLGERRVGHLATADRSGVPHVVPVCFALSEGSLYIAIDEKPKRQPAARLKRLSEHRRERGRCTRGRSL